ncbi:hypothetical protein [Tenacibaculum sp. UWU-22]|uniref:hypothetical protein n=1 Tax=Tenacibaculum sp. UWU-22 TaxID=3234187 RepID=UPI0034DB144C
MLKVKYLFITLLVLTLNSCSSQESQNLLGNVYSFNGNCKKSQESYINGFRIEEISKDSLYVRFYLDKEIFFGISMSYNRPLKEYFSKNTIPFYSNKGKKENTVILNFKNDNIILLKLKDSSNEVKNKIFKFMYKDSIIRDHIRDPYYAEDGFFCVKINFK